MAECMPEGAEDFLQMIQVLLYSLTEEEQRGRAVSSVGAGKDRSIYRI
jgi:hypothetical protein